MNMSVVRVDKLVSSLKRACECNAGNLRKKSNRVNDRVNAALLNATYALLVSARRTQSCSIIFSPVGKINKTYTLIRLFDV